MAPADNTLVSVSAILSRFRLCCAAEWEMLCANVILAADEKRREDPEQWNRELKEFHSQFADESLRF